MKIKQLNFVGGLAETPFGVYCIDSEYEHKFRFSDGSESHRFETVEAAQAAAQADFERRAKQCFRGKAMPTDLTGRQRFALRESLLREIEARCASAGFPWAIYPEVANGLRRLADGRCETNLDLFASLLGEWPVGFRGKGGWEKIEL